MEDILNTYYKFTLLSITYKLNVFGYIFFLILSGVRLSPLGTAAHSGLLYQPQRIGEGDCGAIGGMKIGSGNQKYSEKTCSSATLSTTNLT
jgi:hypothetical protein